MRQSELASLTGLKQPNLSRIENGLVVPRRSTLEKVAMALDLELRDLLSETKVREAEAKWGAAMTPRNAGQLFSGKLTAIPLFQLEDGERLEFDASGYPIGKANITLQLLPVEGRAFGLRMNDASMAGGRAGFREGEVLIFADEPEVASGDFALIQTDTMQVFRQVHFDRGDAPLRLAAADPDSPEKQIPREQVRVMHRLVRRVQEY
ncbi:MAG: helix-turn-helix domain-containing protein [Planctomycetes bacterium]|nr:helix-turn-helix domain-containing protein [Planctomycetota bacterium]